MKITKRQLRKIISEEKSALLEAQMHQDQWSDGITDFIYDQVAAGGDLESEIPTIIAALQDVIKLLQDEEAHPHGGGMHGEDRY